MLLLLFLLGLDLRSVAAIRQPRAAGSLIGLVFRPRRRLALGVLSGATGWASAMGKGKGGQGTAVEHGNGWWMGGRVAMSRTVKSWTVGVSPLPRATGRARAGPPPNQSWRALQA